MKTTSNRPGWKPGRDHPMRATVRRSNKRNPAHDEAFSCTVLIPGADPIPWTGLRPSEVLKLRRVGTPVRIEPDGSRVGAVFELVTLLRTSIVDNMHVYEEMP